MLKPVIINGGEVKSCVGYFETREIDKVEFIEGVKLSTMIEISQPDS
jgi:aerobic-type carbon monoxide dehydrogenase small subunit (CoxS/CutS family)